MRKKSKEEFTLIMYYGSAPCCGIFEELLAPNTFALFQTEPIVENDYVIGIQFNVKEPIKKGDYDGWNGEMKLDQVAGLNLGEIDLGEYDYRLDLPLDLLPLFGLVEENTNEIRCELEGDWLKLYLPPSRIGC